MFSHLFFAIRESARNTSFCVNSILALTIGIGGLCVMLSVARVTVFEPVSYPDSDRLVLIRDENQARGIEGMSTSPANFRDYQRELHSMSGVAAYRRDLKTLTSGGNPVRVGVGLVTAGFFDVLQVAAEHGRTLGARIDSGPDQRVVVLSHGFWKSRFGGDARVVGSRVTIDEESRTIIGVMPETFTFLRFPDLWVPLTLSPDQWDARDARYLRVMGRLDSTLTLDKAQAEADLLSERLAMRDGANDGWRAKLVSLEAAVSSDIRPAIDTLLVSSFGLLAVACASFVVLLLARATSRGAEIATRIALGARLSQILGLFLIESIALALAGGCGGIVGAMLVCAVIRDRIPQLGLRWNELAVDPSIVCLTVVVAIVCGVASGLIPAIAFSRGDARSRLLGPGIVKALRWRRNTFAASLVAVQIALSFVLLVGSGLMLRSLENIARVDLGFDPEGVLSMRIDVSTAAYPEGSARAALYARLLARLRSLPGVSAAGAISSLPLASGNNLSLFEVPGRPASDRDFALIHTVTPGYVEAMKTPLKRGRLFEQRDQTASPAKVLVSETLARRLFESQDPIGRRIDLVFGENSIANEIIGVIGDVRSDKPELEGGDAIYGLYANAAPSTANFVLRSEVDPLSVVAAARRTIEGVDSNLPVSAATMREMVARSLHTRRLVLAVGAVFSALGLVLAAISVFGVVSRSVSGATREIGLRIALGATKRDIRRDVAWYSATLILPGLVVGATTALLASPLLASQMFGVAPTDVASYLGAATMLVVVGLLACAAPATYAASVDPVRALSHE